MNSQGNWQGNNTHLDSIHAWPKYLTCWQEEVLHYSLMFWNILDASMIHLLAKMYDYGIHELSRRQGSKPNTCKPKSMTKSTIYNSLYVSLREDLQHSCIECFMDC